MTPPNLDGSWEAEASSHAIVLTIPDAFLSRVIAEHWEADPRGVEIVPQFLARDRVIEAVMTRLALEAHRGSHSDSLYVTSACEFLAHHIIDGYSSLSKSVPRYSGGLGRRLNTVIDYIEANLARPITLRELAGLAGVSARHFERAFRQRLGLPPHAYVLRRRVSAAKACSSDKPHSRWCRSPSASGSAALAISPPHSVVMKDTHPPNFDGCTRRSVRNKPMRLHRSPKAGHLCSREVGQARITIGDMISGRVIGPKQKAPDRGARSRAREPPGTLP